jgi:class 3 adenylate cyclase
VAQEEQPSTVTFDVPSECGGRRQVEDAPALIQLDVEGATRMLRAHGATSGIQVVDDGKVVVLDTAGDYRYRLVRLTRQNRHVGVYKRI